MCVWHFKINICSEDATILFPRNSVQLCNIHISFRPRIVAFQHLPSMQVQFCVMVFSDETSPFTEGTPVVFKTKTPLESVACLCLSAMMLHQRILSFLFSEGCYRMWAFAENHSSYFRLQRASRDVRAHPVWHCKEKHFEKKLIWIHAYK